MEEKPIEKMTYEEALQELEKVVSSLESGSVALDKSIDLYTRGALLKDHCQKRLIAAEEKISQIINPVFDNFYENGIDNHSHH